MSKKWFVVHAYSGYEKNVARALQERVELSNFGEYFGEILVPTEEVVEMRAGQKRRSERKFFPGYVLVEMELNDDTWHLVKETPRVMGFIGGKADQPAPLTDREAAAILDRALVVTLPGKPGSIRVCLDAVFPAIPYCIDLIGGPRLEGNPDVVDVFRPKGK